MNDDTPLSAYANIWIGVIEQAVRAANGCSALGGYIGKKSPAEINRIRRLRIKEAINWLYSDAQFPYICHLMSINPEKIRQRIK